MKRKNRHKNRLIFVKLALAIGIIMILASSNFEFIAEEKINSIKEIFAERKLNSIRDYIYAPAEHEEEPVVMPFDFMMLVNKKNTVARSFVPDNLVNLAEYVPATKGVIELNARAASDYREMISEMQEAGITGLYAVSGYRSYATQEVLHNNKIASFNLSREQAIIEAGMIVAPPGASEHQTGLALDVSAKSTGYALNSGFAKTEEYEWLSKNCHRFGFILRYPEDKTEITEIIFEPWHIRYVGAEHASLIYESGLCLEEYLLGTE